MRTIRLAFDERFLDEVDRAAARLGTSRSAFTRLALEKSLARLDVAELEARQRAGYKRTPVAQDEVSEWSTEQVWPD